MSLCLTSITSLLCLLQKPPPRPLPLCLATPPLRHITSKAWTDAHCHCCSVALELVAATDHCNHYSVAYAWIGLSLTDCYSLSLSLPLPLPLPFHLRRRSVPLLSCHRCTARSLSLPHFPHYSRSMCGQLAWRYDIEVGVGKERGGRAQGEVWAGSWPCRSGQGCNQSRYSWILLVLYPILFFLSQS